MNPTKLAALLLIFITAFTVFSGVCIAVAFNTNMIEKNPLLNSSSKAPSIPNVSAIGPSVYSADPIGDGKPN